jgi:hypothetical protein
MIKLFASGITFLSLCGSGLLLLQSDFFPEKLPSHPADMALAFFYLFSDPLSAMALLGFALLFAAASFCVTELLLSLVFSITSMAAALLCLLGFIGTTYPPLAHYIEAVLR